MQEAARCRASSSTPARRAALDDWRQQPGSSTPSGPREKPKDRSPKQIPSYATFVKGELQAAAGRGLVTVEKAGEAFFGARPRLRPDSEGSDRFVILVPLIVFPPSRNSGPSKPSSCSNVLKGMLEEQDNYRNIAKGLT